MYLPPNAVFVPRFLVSHVIMQMILENVQIKKTMLAEPHGYLLVTP